MPGGSGELSVGTFAPGNYRVQVVASGALVLDSAVTLALGTGPKVVDQSYTMDSTGNFDFTWYNVLADGETYVMAYYADQDNSGDCDPVLDHAWLAIINPAGPGVPSAVHSDQTLAPITHTTPVAAQASQACTLINTP